MTWNKNTPQGTELISLGDDRIRELKEDLELILNKEHYFPVDNTSPSAIHKFALLTTSQEVNTRNGQIWYNTELKQLSYKIAGQVKRCPRFIPAEFSFLVTSMPTSGQTFWAVKILSTDYAVGVDNNISIHNGGTYPWQIIHTHSVEASNIYHQHTCNIRFTNSYDEGYEKICSDFSSDKIYRDDQGYHHSGTVTYQASANFTHTHICSYYTHQARYYYCFVVKRV